MLTLGVYSLKGFVFLVCFVEFTSLLVDLKIDENRCKQSLASLP